MDILQQIIQLVTILFLLSMVCERIADFLKHYLSESHVFRIQKDFFKVGDTLTKFPKDDSKEQARAFRILKINVWSGILLAAILKADLIKIFNNISEPGKTLGWNNISEYGLLDATLLPLGIILTGCFISFGSKFWHDLLDILYQIKNTKRVLADPETYKVDNIKSLQKLFDTYQSDFIKAAYLEAKTKYMSIDSVKAIGIKSNDLGYYFEITVDRNNSNIEPFYQYLLDDGTPQNIPIKIVVVTDKIIAHSVDLSAKVFDINQQDNWGTLGVIVKPLDNNSNKRYLLTCCHNVVKPIRKVSENEPNPIKAGTIDTTTTEIGTVFKADRDHEMDAALIEIDTQNKKITNSVPQMGNPQKPRQLLNKDAGNVTAFIYGAKTGVENKSVSRGTVTSIFNTIKVTYGNEEFTLINTIAISNNGRAISQGGDSGACVLDSDNNVIGLVVAGNSQVTYALPITTLLTKLNVQLI
jgi:hypothetical protein